ncbi:hypothetical protein BDV93DRAFT_510761 [Ceratobasidium sp. AG-I]|nr:hypothetical protein BDV93DRAFT_510761 [Ceratobasidium sp. AG-I]
MSSRSPATPRKSRFRKFLGNLKDGFRSSSSSRPTSPHLRDTSASSVDLRPPPTTLPRSPSQLVVTQPASLVAPIVGARVTVPTSADANPALTVTKPGAQSAPISEPSAGDKLKKAGETAWVVLKLALDALEKSSDAFPPLKSAVAAFNACLSIVENAAANRDDYENIANELRTMVDTVGEYAKEFAEEDKNGSIRNIISSMEAAAERIRKKQERGKIEQMAMSKQDKDDVMECYRQIEISFRRLQVRAHARRHDAESNTIIDPHWSLDCKKDGSAP